METEREVWPQAKECRRHQKLGGKAGSFPSASTGSTAMPSPRFWTSGRNLFGNTFLLFKPASLRYLLQQPQETHAGRDLGHMSYASVQ